MLRLMSKAISQQHLNISFSVSRTYMVRIVEAPSLWMKDDELNLFLADLRLVASAALPNADLDYGVLGTDRSRLDRSVITLVSSKSEPVPIAFNALARMDVDLGHRSEEVLHLGLVMVDPNQRSQGLSWVLYGLTCILMLFRNGMRPVWISNVTQVPAVVGLVATGFARVFPAPRRDQAHRRSLIHLLLARQIMRNHRHVFGVGDEADFDEDRFIITNAYTGGSDDLKKTFQDAPKHRDEAVNFFCERELDYERGDDVLQLGQIDLSIALSYLAREVPPRSFTAVIMASMAIVLNRLALPVWHWFDGTRDLGSLRATEDKT
ncbi:MAG: hypothetical protein AAF826_09320 [Pseudomonadota bacterium]